MKMDMTESGTVAQLIQIQRLRAGGVPVVISRLNRTLHDKFSVIDDVVIAYRSTDHLSTRSAR